jgi:ribosomal protein S27E
MLKSHNATAVTCKICGSVYLRRAERVNFRGKDEKNCEVCGELLESWDGRRLPTFKLVKRGELTKRQQ